MIPENEKFNNLYALSKKKRKKMLKKFDKEIEFFELFEPNKLFDGSHPDLPKLKPGKIRELKYLMYIALNHALDELEDKYPLFDATGDVFVALDVLLNKENRLGVYEDPEKDAWDEEEPKLVRELAKSGFITYEGGTIDDGLF